MNAKVHNEEILHEWSARMLKVIHRIDANIIGGIGGLGSTDGVYIDAGKAMRILQEFEKCGYKVISLGDEDDDGLLALDHSPNGEWKRGLLVDWDEEFEGERVLYWYDEYHCVMAAM